MLRKSWDARSSFARPAHPTDEARRKENLACISEAVTN